MSSSDNSTVVYCGQGLDDFHTQYHVMHGYLSLTVCILGCIANILNVVVLTRRDLRSPTNAILTGLAIADFLVMIDYIPFAWLDYILPSMNYSRRTLFSYSTAWYIMFHSIFAQICHTISIWLTVMLAVWRYIAVAYPQRNRIWCNMRTTLITIACAYVVCPFAAIPLYLASAIQPTPEILDANGQIYRMNDSSRAAALSPTTTPSTMAATATPILSDAMTAGTTITTSLPIGFKNVTVYRVQYSEIANNNPSLIRFNLWMYSIVIKLIPCFALTILSLRLIGALLEAKRRRKQLLNSNGMKKLVNGKAIDGSSGNSNRKNTKSLEKEKQTDRTTRMLLAVLLLFLITEFPQGILGLLGVLLGHPFVTQCYLKLGDLVDILALINSGINFILYCSMSRQFRKTFIVLFRPAFLSRWLSLGQDDENQAGNTYIGRDENNGLTTQVTQV